MTALRAGLRYERSVLALPSNVIAGLLGMNVGGIPFAAHRRDCDRALPAALTVGAAVLALRKD